MTDHSASRGIRALDEAGYEHAAPSTPRLRALEEIVERTYDLGFEDEGAVVRIRELARILHALEPREAGEWSVGADNEQGNAVRARAALLSLAAFPLLGEVDLTQAEELEQAAGDLICDLLHLVARSGGWPLAVVSSARRHWSAETGDPQGRV